MREVVKSPIMGICLQNLLLMVENDQIQLLSQDNGWVHGMDHVGMEDGVLKD